MGENTSLSITKTIVSIYDIIHDRFKKKTVRSRGNPCGRGGHVSDTVPSKPMSEKLCGALEQRNRGYFLFNTATAEMAQSNAETTVTLS